MVHRIIITIVSVATLIVVSLVATMSMAAVEAGNAVPGISAIGQPVMVDVGTLAGDVLTWVAAIIGPPLAGVIGLWLQRWAKQIGIDVADKDRKRLEEFVQNGIDLGVQQARERAEHLSDIEVRNRALALAVQYAQRHGRETLKRLGAPDPTSPEVEEALRARAARILNSVAPPPA